MINEVRNHLYDLEGTLQGVSDNCNEAENIHMDEQLTDRSGADPGLCKGGVVRLPSPYLGVRGCYPRKIFEILLCCR